MGIKVITEQHDKLDKSFGVSFGDDLYIRVDYDDVDHTKVDAAIDYLTSLVTDKWDNKEFEVFYTKHLNDEWNKNEYGLQKDYDSLEDFLSQHGIKQ